MLQHSLQHRVPLAQEVDDHTCGTKDMSPNSRMRVAGRRQGREAMLSALAHLDYWKCQLVSFDVRCLLPEERVHKFT